MRMNPILLILGTLAAIVGGWGLYTVMVDIGQAPAFVAVISICIFELFAVGLGIHAVKVAGDGDSPFVFNAGIVLIAILAALVQFGGAIAEGKGVLFGLVMAMAPISAITLWVVEMRRFFRLRGRAAGTVAQPAATIEPVMWLRFWKQAWAAKRYALVDRSLGADDALKLGLISVQQRAKPKVPVRVQRHISIESVLPELQGRSTPAVTAAVADEDIDPENDPLLPAVRAWLDEEDETPTYRQVRARFGVGHNRAKRLLEAA